MDRGQTDKLGEILSVLRFGQRGPMLGGGARLLSSVSALRIQATAEAVCAARIVAESVQLGAGAVQGDVVGAEVLLQMEA